MANENVFDYDSLKTNPKTAPKSILRLFTRAGETIASSWVEGEAPIKV